MQYRRWDDEPIEQLTASIGRQVLNTETMTVARIHLAAGAVVPTHHHENEQVVNVIAGRLRFLVDGQDELVATAGDSVALPGNIPHQVEALEDSLVLDVFSPVREDWLRGEDAYLRSGSR